MRQLIEKSQVNQIVCDNPKCDYEIPWTEEGSKNIIRYIGKPCPKCGENLLTIEDYLQHERLIKVIDWMNKWLSWTTLFCSKKTGRYICEGSCPQRGKD